MSIIEGVYEKKLLKDEKNGYTIFSLRPEADDNLLPKINDYGCIVCKGTAPPFKQGQYIRVEGEWKKDDYGSYLEIKHTQEAVKDAAVAIRYLASGIFGISYDKAKFIVDTFGSDIYAFAQKPNAAKLLSEKTDLSERKASVIVSTILGTIHWRELMDYGFGKKLPYTAIQRLVDDYGGRAKEVLCNNPYEIGLKYGAPFECCDMIAFDNGFGPINKQRFSAIARLTLEKDESSGNMFMYEKDLFEACQRQLSKVSSAKIPTSLIETAISEEKEMYIERDDENRYYLFSNRQAEIETAKQINRLIKGGVDLPFTEDCAAYAEKMCGVTLAPEQRASLGLLKKTGLAILTGGPGTGKTTTMKAIITAYQRMCPTGRIKLCAPSGRAAQRMSEQTGMEASTIHRLLEYKPYGKGKEVVGRNADNPLEADLIIVDESSMVDLKLACMLLSAVKTGALVLLAGDINQLQSVGAGDFLNDCIKSECVPVVQLIKVYRQASTSPIISNAYAINQGRSDLTEDKNQFEILTCAPERMAETISAIIETAHKDDNKFFAQVLCPTHKSDGGVGKINRILQQKLNPAVNGEETLLYGGEEFRRNDKIIMLKNNPDMGYFNGDIGIVKKIEKQEITVVIQDKEIVLTRDQYDDIKLAYAMTVHKSQGSEFPFTVISLPRCNMLQRNLLYTGVTRGKETVVIVQEDGCIEKSIMKSEVGKRNSLLMKRIRKETGWTEQ